MSNWFFTGFKIVKKDREYAYIHSSGSISDLDIVICSSYLETSAVYVQIDENDIDHLSIPFRALHPLHPFCSRWPEMICDKLTANAETG
jgi:hypothetical protein